MGETKEIKPEVTEQAPTTEIPVESIDLFANDAINPTIEPTITEEPQKDQQLTNDDGFGDFGEFNNEPVAEVPSNDGFGNFDEPPDCFDKFNDSNQDMGFKHLDNLIPTANKEEDEMKMEI